jgi:hypothetical protein
MSKWLIIVFILCSLKGFCGANFDVGTGSGTTIVNSMTGHARGDTANIIAGTYTGGTFSNLFGIYIRQKNLGLVVYTGTVNMFADSGVYFGGSLGDSIVFSHITGSAINNNTSTVGQGWVDVELRYMKFIKGTASCIDQAGNMRYVQGNNASYHWLRVKIHDTYEDSCIHFIQGSFGNTGDVLGPPDWDREFQWYNWVSEASQATGNGSARGMEFFGICTHCRFHDYKQTMDNTEGPEGDIGIFEINGWAVVYNGYKNGGPGYHWRSNGPIQEDNDPGRDTGYNLIKVNSTGYGVIAMQQDSTQSVAGKWHGTGGTFYNLTIGNNTECCGYWGPLVNNGNCPPYENYFCGNGVAVNNQTNGKNKTWVNLGGSPGWASIGTDTLVTPQQAYASFTAAGYDTTTVLLTNASGSFAKYIPLVNSPVRNKGQNLGAIFSLDIYGVQRSGIAGLTWDPGATQYPFASTCNCHIRVTSKSNIVK